MKLKYFLLQLFFFWALLFKPYGAFANSNEAQNWAASKGEQILKILGDKNLERKYADLDKILYEDIDLDHAARFVMGRYWRKMNDEQKETYLPLFKRYTAAAYKSFPLDIPENSIGYEIIKIQPNKDFFDVICNISIKQTEKINNEKNGATAKINVIFSLTKQNQKIMVRDLKIGESSLLIAYRERFNKMIHDDNDDEIDWFLEDLENITADKEQENLLKLEKMRTK